MGRRCRASPVCSASAKLAHRHACATALVILHLRLGSVLSLFAVPWATCGEFFSCGVASWHSWVVSDPTVLCTHLDISRFFRPSHSEGFSRKEMRFTASALVLASLGAVCSGGTYHSLHTEEQSVDKSSLQFIDQQKMHNIISDFSLKSQRQLELSLR